MRKLGKIIKKETPQSKKTFNENEPLRISEIHHKPLGNVTSSSGTASAILDR